MILLLLMVIPLSKLGIYGILHWEKTCFSFSLVTCEAHLNISWERNEGRAMVPPSIHTPLHRNSLLFAYIPFNFCDLAEYL